MEMNLFNRFHDTFFLIHPLFLEVPSYANLTKGERKSLTRNGFYRTKPSVFSNGKGGYQKETTAGEAQKYVSKGQLKGVITNSMGIKVQNTGVVNCTYRPEKKKGN